MTLEEIPHVIVISQKLEGKRMGSILEHQTQLQADTDFVPLIAEFTQTDAAVQMWLAH